MHAESIPQRPGREVPVGGVGVTPFRSIDHAIHTILDGGERPAPGFWVAMNAEKVIQARRQPEVMETLQSASVRYPDGIGVVYTMASKGVRSARVPGIDLWHRLMRAAGGLGLSVFLFGGTARVNSDAQRRLEMEFGVEIAGARHGYDFDPRQVMDQIRRSSAHVVTVAIGSPRQEHFIRQCRRVAPDRFYLGVGGALDVFTGHVRRAPEWMGNAGLEWLFRLAQQPSRFSRQRACAEYALLQLRGRL